MFKRTRIGAAAAFVASGLALQAGTALAQDTQRIEITGSSIKRIDAETALPVTVMTREEIQRSGVVNTEQLLQSLTAVSTQGALGTSTGAGISTYGVASVSLRGLGEDRTLVLVNGRRLAAFAGGNGTAINVNSIPLAAVERVEVLKDGASAVYGSDAIAGVVNFILRRDFTGIELGATLGTPTRSGGGDSARATIVAGFGGDRFNVTLSGSLEKEKAIFGRDRDYAKSAIHLPFFLSGATGQGNIEGAYTPGTGVPTPGPDGINIETGSRQPGFGNSPPSGYGNPLALQDNCQAVNMVLSSQTTAKGAPFCEFDTGPFVGLLPDRELGTFSANASFKLADNIELFGDALYSRSKVTQAIQTSPLRRSFMLTDQAIFDAGVDPALLVRPTNPAYQIAVDYLNAMQATNPDGNFAALIGQPIAVTARVFDFGPRTSEDTSTQARLVAGFRGTIANQDYEVAAIANRNKLDGKVIDGYFSQLGFAHVINDLTNDYNPWTLTQSQSFNDTLAANNVKYIGPTLIAESKSNALEGKLSGDLFSLPAGMAQYALGLQVRKETFTLDPSDALLSGDIAGLGGAIVPMDEDRRITSGFVEVVAPLIKGLEADLALRHDRYNDVGNSTTGKVSLRWQPISEVLVRGTFGTGFRAPTLVDLHYPQTLGTSEQFNDPGTGQTDLQVNSLTGGNPDLKPEKSDQFSLGVVLQPTRAFSFGADYFKIKVKDIISQPTAQEVVSRFRAGDSTFAGNVTLTPTGEVDSIIQTLANAGTADVQGVDLNSNYRMDLGGGRLDVAFTGTYMLKFDQTSPGGAVSRKVGRTVEGVDGTPVLSSNSSDNGGVVLRWKHYLAGTWTQGPWAFTLAQNFYSGYRDGNDLNNSKHSVPAQALYDAQVEFTGVKNLRLALGVKNLFDKDPPIFIPVSNQFQSGYDATLYDPRSRFVYVSANYKF